MIENLLYISKELLSYLDSDNNLSITEEKYILSVIHKIILVLTLKRIYSEKRKLSQSFKSDKEGLNLIKE